MDNGCNLHYKPRTPITAFKHEVLATLEICQNKDDGKLTKKKSNKKKPSNCFQNYSKGIIFLSIICLPSPSVLLNGEVNVTSWKPISYTVVSLKIERT